MSSTLSETVGTLRRSAEYLGDAGAAVLGIDAYPVDVEVDLGNGLPSFSTVGLPQGAVKEGRERVTAALLNTGFEFPSTNYKRVGGKAYRFAYGASDGHRGNAYSSAIVKIDIETGGSSSFSDGTHIFGEPLFVSRPGGESEDDGVLLTVGSAQDAESSVLAIIDARSMAPLALATVQSSIPLGFHGSFLRNES